MLNFEMGPTSNTDSSLFDVCFETIFASFSFNDEVKFWKLGNEVSSQGQFVTQATSLHDFRLLYNNVNIELRSCSDRKIRVTRAKSGITRGSNYVLRHSWCQIWHSWPVFSDPNAFGVQYSCNTTERWQHCFSIKEKRWTGPPSPWGPGQNRKTLRPRSEPELSPDTNFLKSVQPFPQKPRTISFWQLYFLYKMET